MKNIEQTILACAATLCVGLMIGILIGRFGLSPSVQLSTYDQIAQDIPDPSAPRIYDTTGKININTASANELTMIPGIGKIGAENIVAYRSRYGPFMKIDDIINVKGISEDRFEKIKQYITVGG